MCVIEVVAKIRVLTLVTLSLVLLTRLKNITSLHRWLGTYSASRCKPEEIIPKRAAFCSFVMNNFGMKAFAAPLLDSNNIYNYYFYPTTLNPPQSVFLVSLVLYSLLLNNFEAESLKQH